MKKIARLAVTKRTLVSVSTERPDWRRRRWFDGTAGQLGLGAPTDNLTNNCEAVLSCGHAKRKTPAIRSSKTPIRPRQADYGLGKEQTVGRVGSSEYNWSFRRPAGCRAEVNWEMSNKHRGETGVVADRLSPGRQCVETDEDGPMLAVFVEAIEQAQATDRTGVRDRATELFDADRIIDVVMA